MLKYRKMLVGVSFLGGFILGILFMNLSGDTYFLKDLFVFEKIWENVKINKGKTEGGLYFLIKMRSHSYLILGMLGQIWAGKVWMTGYGIWFCLLEGIWLTQSFLQNRLKGIWMGVLLQLPHMICYAAVYLYLIQKFVICQESENGIFKRYDSEKKYSYFAEWVKGIPVIAAGIITEYYVGMWWLDRMQLWIG